MGIAKGNNTVLQSLNPDTLVNVGSVTVANGTRARINLSPLSRLTGQAKVRGVKLRVLGLLVTKEQTVTVASNAGRPGIRYCSMLQRMSMDVVWVDYPGIAQVFWPNNGGGEEQGFNSPSHINQLMFGHINPNISEEMVGMCPLTRGSWPQYASSDTDFALLSPDNGARPDVDRLLGFWNADLRMQTCVQNTGAPITEPRPGDARADYCVIPTTRASQDGLVEGFPIESLIQADHPLSVEYTPHDCGMYDAGTTYGDATITVWALIAEDRDGPGGHDEQTIGVPYYIDTTVLGSSPYYPNLEYVNPTILIPPKYRSVTTATIAPAGVPIRYEPREFEPILREGKRQYTEEQLADSSQMAIVFPLDPSDQNPGAYLRFWNQTTKGCEHGRMDNRRRYRGELVEMDCRNGWFTSTRFSANVAGCLTFSALGRATMGAFNDYVGVFSPLPFWPIVISAMQLKGFPSIGNHGVGIGKPAKVNFTFTPPDGTETVLDVIYDRPELIDNIIASGCGNPDSNCPTPQGNMGGYRPALDNPSSPKAALAADNVGVEKR